MGAHCVALGEQLSRSAPQFPLLLKEEDHDSTCFLEFL